MCFCERKELSIDNIALPLCGGDRDSCMGCRYYRCDLTLCDPALDDSLRM